MKTTSKNDLQRMLNASQVARLLNVSQAHTYALMQRGEIPTVSVGNSKRVLPQDLQKYINQHKNRSARDYNDS